MSELATRYSTPRNIGLIVLEMCESCGSTVLSGMGQTLNQRSNCSASVVTLVTHGPM